MNCEACHEMPAEGWYLVDDNAEVELCSACARALRAHASVVEIGDDLDPDDPQVFAALDRSAVEDRWICPQCDGVARRVVARRLIDRADPTESIELECGHYLI